MKGQIRRKHGERGVALILAMLLILVLGILASAVMFTSQSQGWGAMNYRMTMQSRYAAEAGIQKTMNWLSNNYVAPTTFASYTMNTNPVSYNNSPVVLSAVSGVSSNYPDSSQVSAYSNALGNVSIPGIPSATVSTYATLLRMNSAGGVPWLGSAGGGGVVQTWQITSVASMSGVRSATVQVTQTFERTGTPVFNYPVEATSTSCASLKFAGRDYTDSYSSALGVYSASNSANTGGNIATNGNATLGGIGHGGPGESTAASIGGTVYVPNTTVGACPDGITASGGSTYVGATQLSSPLLAPLPWGCTSQPCYPSPVPPTTAMNISTGCPSIDGCTSNGTTTLDDGGASTTVKVFTLTPGSYGNIRIDNADVVHVSAGNYYINSINFAADAQFVVDSGPVIFNLAGNCSSGCPSEGGYSPSTSVLWGSGYAGLNACSGGVTANPNVYARTTCGAGHTPFSGIPSQMQIVYGGTNLIRLGGMPDAAVIYAPQSVYYAPGAPVGLYGSAVVATFDDESGSPYHYDRALQNTVTKVGPFRPVGGFSWSKF